MMKTKMVPVRMNERMLDALDAKQKQLQARSRSALIREALDLYFHSDKPQLTRALIEEFQVLRKELHRAGRNLNQIAYRLNAGHPLSSHLIEEQLAELRLAFKALSMGVKEVRHELDV